MSVKQTLCRPGSAPVKIWTDDVEASAMQQLRDMATLPFVHSHIAVMPDCHWGCGSTVGSVIPTIGAIVPASVGVDLGCGMSALRLSLKGSDLPDNLADVRARIEAVVPHGRTDQGGVNDRGAWHNMPFAVEADWNWLRADNRLVRVLQRHPDLFGQRTLVSAGRQLGTLGTGNHFVEICLDLNDQVWIMLHSGSRGIGNRIGTYFIAQAKEIMQREGIKVAHPDLSYIRAADAIFEDYWMAISWAQRYAAANRDLMMRSVRKALDVALGRTIYSQERAVNCHHNYVAVEHHYGEDVYVTRKGAVNAEKGKLGIIPGSMGARSFIVRGKGHPESFNSCSHGAGRKMSRTQARKQFTLEDLAAQTAGIECRKDADVLDEIPGAYKDIQEVMNNQSDLVEIVAELRQVLCVKG